MTDTHRVTQLLHEFACGEKASLDQLIPLVYDELRKIADGQLRRERKGHTLQPTALVHEVYARMVGGSSSDYRDRIHFLSTASQIMRRILIDHARMKSAGKRGGGQVNIAIDESRDASGEQPLVFLDLEDALEALEREAPRKARLIEMQYFGGLTAEESAEVLEIDVATVRRELRVAKAWLQRELERSAARPKKNSDAS